jgi:hypothetical protein
MVDVVVNFTWRGPSPMMRVLETIVICTIIGLIVVFVLPVGYRNPDEARFPLLIIGPASWALIGIVLGLCRLIIGDVINRLRHRRS